MTISPSDLNKIINIADRLRDDLNAPQEKSIEFLNAIAKDIAIKSGLPLHELAKKVTHANKKAEKEYKKRERERQEQAIRDKLAKNPIIKGYSDLTDGIGKVNKTAVKFSNSLVNNSSPLTTIANKIADALPLFGFSAVLVAGISAVEESLQGLGTLSKAGITVSGGILGTIEATARLGLSFQEGVTALHDNRLAVNDLGVPAITGFVDNLRNSSDFMYDFGFSVADVAKKGMQYLSIERKLQRSNISDVTRREQGFKEQLHSFYKTSQMVGTDLSTLMDQIEKSAEDPIERLALNSLPEEVRDAFAVLRDQAPDLADAIIQAQMRGGNLARIDKFSEFSDINALPFLQELLDTMNAGGEGASQRILEIISGYSGHFKSQAELMGNFHKMDRALLASVLATLGENINDNPNLAAGNKNPLTTAIIQYNAAMDNFVKNVHKVIVQQFSELEVDEIIKNVTELAKAFRDLMIGLKDIGDIDPNSTFFGVLSLSKISAAVTGISTAIGNLSEMVSENALATAIGGIFAASLASPLIRSSLVSAAGYLLSSFADQVSKVKVPTLSQLTDLFSESLDIDNDRRNNRTRPNRMSRIGDRIRSGISNLRSSVGNIARSIGGVASSLVSSAGNLARSAATTATSALTTAGNIARSAANTTASAVSSAGKSVGNVLFSSAGKTILKKIPGLSIAAGIGFGLSELIQGDLLGAGAELVSGLASTLPGLGTAASVAIDASMIARDNMNDQEKQAIDAELENLRADDIVPTEAEISEMDITTARRAIEDLKQKIAENKIEERRAVAEIPADYDGLNRYERKKYEEERARIRREILENYKLRNEALRAAIGAFQFHTKETERLSDKLPDMMIAP